MRKLFGFLFLFAFTPAALAQIDCSGQVAPLKPLTVVGCQDTDTMLLCSCNGLGTGCHWTWACFPYNGLGRAPVYQPRQMHARRPSPGINPLIPLMAQPIGPIADPLDIAVRAQELRLLGQQTELLRQQTEALQAQESAPSSTAPPTPESPARTVAVPLKTAGLVNGRAWQLMDENWKMLYLSAYRDGLRIGLREPGKLRAYFSEILTWDETRKAVDSFYADPLNVAVPISGAIQAVTLKAVGVEEAAISKLVSEMRALADK